MFGKLPADSTVHWLNGLRGGVGCVCGDVGRTGLEVRLLPAITQELTSRSSPELSSHGFCNDVMLLPSALEGFESGGMDPW